MSSFTCGSIIAFSLTASTLALAQSPATPGYPATEPAPNGVQPPNEAPPPVPAPPPPAELPSVVSKFKVQIYGFAELDMIHDTTQSFAEIAGNGGIARPNTYAGEHGRMAFSVRNSRLGFKVGGPSNDTFKTSAVAEMDFLGNQPANPPTLSEAAFYANPAFRVRHMWMKLETPVVDVLAGQTWDLFGWQAYFIPASVQIHGLPGELFTRAPQLRLSHTFKSEAVNLDVAVAASRPPERDGDAPDGQAGLRLTINEWKGYRTANSTGTSLDAAAIGVSGTVRNFNVQELSATPLTSNRAKGWGVSFDALLPIVPASKENHANALTLTASFATGTGISDLYTGLSGGNGYPRVTAADGTMVAFTPNVDNGPVTYNAAGELETIDWMSVFAGIQYYLPVGGLWVAANVSHMHSGNIDSYGAAPASVWTDSTFYDGNLFWDALEGVRFGLEVAHFEQTFADDVKAKNNRIQLSSFYLF
jgi:hypothetical protein